MSGCAFFVIKVLDTELLGQVSQRTESLSSARPGGISFDATSMSVVMIAGGGGAEASTAGVPPPSKPRTSRAAAPAAIAATHKIAIRVTFMGWRSFAYQI
jgi:hypothetical protein